MIEHVQALLAEQGIDALLLWGRDGSEEFFIEWLAHAYPRSAARLIVPQKGIPILEVPLMEVSRMRDAAKVRVEPLNDAQLARFSGKKIGYNAEYLAVNELSRLVEQTQAAFIDLSERLRALREIKTLKEQAMIAKACKIGDSILGEARRAAPKMRSERELANFIKRCIEERGLEPSFPPIVASGKNAKDPHHEPGDGPLAGWCIVDMGVRYQGYCSDMTRTWFFGTQSRQDKERYALVLAAQERGMRSAKPGVRGCDVDALVRTELGSIEPEFIHGLGHAVGLEIHDPGTGLNKREQRTLKEGMVVTLEPGVYGAWGGIRIEDTVAIDAKGATPLTRSPKELVIFKRARR